MASGTGERHAPRRAFREGADVEPAIETHRLTRTFGPVRAVDSIDLAVPAGRVFGFLGPNGSGKTTTIRLLLGLIRATSGEARLLGEPTGPRAPVVTRVGALVERPAFYSYLSATENLLVFGVTAGLDEHPLRARLPAALARVGLADVGRRGVGGFSTGMRQRLALALALLREPELLILDEPTNGLDPAGVVEVRQLIAALARDGTTVFLSTHVLTEVEQLCSDVAVLVRGRVVAQRPTRELLGAGAGIRLRFDGPEQAAAAVTVIRAAGFVVHDEAPPAVAPASLAAMIVEAAPDAGSRLARLLAENGLYPAELAPVRPTLEAAFLELTLDPAAPDSPDVGAGSGIDRAGAADGGGS